MTQPYAQLPAFSTSIGAVTFGSTAPTHGATTSQNDNVGGFKASTAPGGLFVQAPGLVLPMLWHRGSMQQLGMFSRIGSLPALGAFDYFTGDYAIWWDSPQSWGRANYLIRRPRTLIILDNLGVAEAWVNANYTSVFAPLNVSVCVTQSGQLQRSWIAAGVPLAASNTAFSDEYFPGDTIKYSLPTTNSDLYVGGDCFVAQLQDCIFGPKPSAFNSFNGYVVPSASTSSPSSASPFMEFIGTDSHSPVNNLLGLVNFAKATNDVAVLVAGSAKFRTFASKLYQYNVNPFSGTVMQTYGATLPITPDPLVPSSNADTLIEGSGGILTRQTFTNGDSTDMLAQLLTDAVAFFPPLP
jgi:hypothetical protein